MTSIGDVFLSGIEIETPSGYVPFSGIRKLPISEVYRFDLESGKYIDCSLKHLFFKDGIEVLAKELRPNDLIDTIDGKERIKNITLIIQDNVYDVLGVENNDSSYISNKILHHNCSFTGSTVTLIDGDSLAKLKGEDPPYTPTPFYSIWKKYVVGRVYGFGIDTAQGAGSDYSVISIFDITNFLSTGKYEQVALYRRNDQNIFNFTKDVLELAKKWGEPVIICENNETGLGNILCNQLYMEDGYERVYYDIDSGKYGITANSKTKKLATTYFKEDVESGNCIIISKIEINELGFFEEKEGSHGTFAARKGRGFNDDTVAASYWFSFLLRSRWFEDISDEIYTNPGNRIVTEVKDEEKLNEETLDTFNNIFTSDTDHSGDDFEKELWR